MKSSLILLLLFATSAFAANAKKPTTADVPPQVKEAMAAVNPNNIRTHVQFLSSNALEGRGTGQRGGDIAA